MVKTSLPWNNSFGTDDQSWRAEPPMPESKAQFRPLFFIRSAKGRTKKFTSNFAKANYILGQDTFDKNKKFYNTSTLYMEGVFSATGIAEIQRVVDPNLVVKSNATLWIDIALDDLPEYKRDHLGNYIIGSDGEPETTGDTIEGYKYKIYLSHIDDDTYDNTKSGRDIYKESVQTGFMTDKNGEDSTMYPLVTFIASSLGEILDLEGFTIEPLIGDKTNQDLIDKNRLLGYIFKRYSKASGEKKPVEHFYGSNSVNFVFKEQEKDPLTDIPLQLEYYLPNYWDNNEEDLKSEVAPMMYSDFDEPIVYYENVATVSNILFEKEADYITTEVKTWDDGLDAATSEWFTEFECDDTRAYAGQDLLFNILTGLGVKEKHYFTFVRSDAVVSEETDDITVSDSVVLYLSGGSDGEIYDDATYNELVRAKLDEYKDPNNAVNIVALNTENCIIDCEFELDTKLAISNALTARRDIVPVICTHTFNKDNVVLEPDEEIAIVNMITSRFSLFPESEYYGTKHSKTLVITGTALAVGVNWRWRVSKLYDLTIKFAEMMGTGNGIWKSEKLFVGDNDRNKVKYVKDCRLGQENEPTQGICDVLWNAGGSYTYPENFKIDRWVAVQTIYPDHTSVLKNPASGFAISKIEKVHQDIWVRNSGTVDKTDAQFVQDVTKQTEAEINGIFDGVFKTKVECTITDYDAQLGYSYNLETHLYGGVGKTSQYSHITMHRFEDLQN